MADRLSAVDSAFLDAETGDTPSLTIGGCLIMEGPPPDLAEIREFVLSRRPLVPKLFQRLKRSTIDGVNRATWVDDEPDLEYHIQCDEIGDDPRGLNGAVAKLMERQLDRERPLWEATVFTDLPESGQWAVVWRVHHSIADGQGLSLLLGHFSDLSPEGGLTFTDAVVTAAVGRQHEVEAQSRDKSDHPTNALSALVHGVSDSLTTLRDVVTRVPDTAHSLLDFSPRLPSELSGGLTDGRSWVAVEGSLAAAKAIGHKVDGTANDAILAAVAQGLAAVLQARGSDTAGKSVRCLMPVSMRDPQDPGANNQVSILPIKLPVDIDDPRRLIAAVHKTTAVGKHSYSAQLLDAFAGLASVLVPNRVEQAAMTIGGELLGFLGDVIVTNVPGPQMPLYFMGRRELADYPILPVGATLRFGVAIVSFAGKVEITITGDDQSWDEVELLATTVRDRLDQWADELAGA